MRQLFVAVALLLTVAAASIVPWVRIRFSPESEPFAEAAREYQSLWEEEGSRIIAATVLAGSTVEALRLWALQRHDPAKRETAITSALGKTLQQKPPCIRITSIKNGYTALCGG
jgi:hypothetical protein